MHSSDELVIKRKPSGSPQHALKKSAKSTTETQVYLPNKFISHHPKAGINPLVDAAAYIFSIVGQLKQLKSYRQLNQLQKELIEEIDRFYETAKGHGYNSDFILVSRYAISVTLDDIISHTSWGTQGQWDGYCLQNVFNSGEPSNNERFFLILEKIVKDPSVYIDLMEFMYICLSLGFKGNHRTTEYGNTQIEHITDALYKHIRAYQGNFSKTLAPYSIKVPPAPKTVKSSPWIIATLTAGIIIALFIGLGVVLDSISDQASLELTHIGKSILYETPESA